MGLVFINIDLYALCKQSSHWLCWGFGGFGWGTNSIQGWSFLYLRESSKGGSGRDQIPRFHAQSVLITLFFVRVGEMGVKGVIA